MNDLLLFGLQYLGRSVDVQKLLHTNKHIFILENGELYMRDLEAKTDFEKIAPDHVFSALSLDNVAPSTLCIADGTKLHFYDYKVHKLLSYTMNIDFVTCAWSPSNEIIALVTSEGKLKTLSFNAEGVLLAEQGENYIANNNPQHGHFNLSWDAKSLDVSEQFADSLEVGCVQDTSEPTIAWRGTSTMFVVNFYVANKATRVFKVFSNDCKYLFEGVRLEGLQSAVAWKPGLSFYLTMPVARKAKMVIGLFEKSGALHDWFCLRDNLFVAKIEWSSDGQVLAVLQKDQSRTPLSLYLYKNKQWGLKQYLVFEDLYLAKSFHWLANSDNIMYPLCILTDENIYKYVFKKGCYVTSGHKSEHHMAAFATVDGNKLDLTLFVENVLLMPNSMFQKELPKPISNVLFHPTCPKLVVMDCDTTLYLCEYSLDGVSIIRRYEWDDLKKLPFMLHHMYWGVDDYLYCVGLSKTNPKVDKLFMGDLKSGSTGEVYFLPYSDLPTDLTYIGYAHNTNMIIEQRYTEIGLRADKNIMLTYTIDFKIIPIKVDAVEIDSVNYIIALTRVCELYINFQKVINSVTSFYIHNNYLLVTRQQGALLCLRLKDEGIQKLITDNLRLEEIYTVPIDLDTILVTGIPNTPEIILQLSRSKFETVRMKPIIIDCLEEQIKELNWLEAYNIACKEELDLNVLIDLDVDRFLDQIPIIIDLFQNASLLNKIIESLSEENVFTKAYKYCHIQTPLVYPNKVQTICTKLLTHLGNSSNAQKYLTSLVMCCMIGYHTFGLKEALFHISKTFTENIKSDNLKKNISEAVLYLKSQKNQLEVFQETLLTFNVPLIECIARILNVSSPKYEEFFANLRSLDYISQRLVINQHLAEGTFVTVPKLMIFNQAKLKKSHQTFETLPRNASAQILEKNRAELKQAECLESKSNLTEACKIYEKCLGHLESTCSLLAKKHSFFGAVRIAKKHRKDDLIEKDVLPIAENYCNELIHLIDTKISAYNKLIAHLVTIRENLLQTPSAKNVLELYRKNTEPDLDAKEIDLETKEMSSNTDSEADYIETLQDLYALIEEAFNQKNDVREICYVLLSCPKVYYRKCKALHDSLYEFHIKIIKDVPLIWPSPSDVNEEVTNDDLTSNFHYLKPPANITLNWILPYFVNK